MFKFCQEIKAKERIKMINKEFVDELFILCKKYKQNITAKIDTDENNLCHYEVDITGAWAIRNDYNAVEVRKIQPEILEYSIKGDK